AVLTSILMGFSLYYVKNFAQILGDNGQIPIWVAAWAPPVASLMLSVGLVLQMEDG
ncbi:MAG: LptF/LptG family permease, partial [Paracoccus sp. (in: a-proteobacteria)]